MWRRRQQVSNASLRQQTGDVYRWLAQLNALEQKRFGAFDVDLMERQVVMAASIDTELDFFAACIGLTKTVIDAYMKEDGRIAAMSFQSS